MAYPTRFERVTLCLRRATKDVTTKGTTHRTARSAISKLPAAQFSHRARELEDLPRRQMGKGQGARGKEQGTRKKEVGDGDTTASGEDLGIRPPGPRRALSLPVPAFSIIGCRAVLLTVPRATILSASSAAVVAAPSPYPRAHTVIL